MAGSVAAQQGEQDDVSKALDSTAAQWSFQVVYQTMPDYKDDWVDGQRSPEGSFSSESLHR